MREPAKDTLLVDGYNVIHAWPELIAIKDVLDHARDRLVDIMAGYGAFKNLRVIIVFDAHGVPGDDVCQMVSKDLEIVYTNEGETADSYIEKLAYVLVRQGEKVYVVTSDWTEQMVILGVGAFRISSRELRQQVKEFDEEVKAGFTESVITRRRHELGNRLSWDVMKRLDEIRRGH